MKKGLLLIVAICMIYTMQGQNQVISVCGEASGVLAAQYASFTVILSDAECSMRFPDLQSKQKGYTELTKEFKIAAADNEFIAESTTRQNDYEGAKDVHTVSYRLTIRESSNFMIFQARLEDEIDGSVITLERAEFGDNNASREQILIRAYADAKHRAEVLVKQANGKLGKIVSMTEELEDKGGSVIEELFKADKMYKRDRSAYAYTELFPSFHVLIRVTYEWIPN
jgi:Protein of unknown function (DUF541)